MANEQNLRPPFSSTNQPDPSKRKGGRKPSALKKYINDNNLGADDIAAAAKYVLPLTRDQMKKMVTDPKVPFMMQIFIKSMLEDFKRGNTTNVMAILDRAVGKPKEKHEHAVGVTLVIDQDDAQV